MKNILLATILLSTIACNGSGGGGPKVDVGPKITTMTYSIYDDVVDTDFNPCGNGNLREEVGNVVKICELKDEYRPLTTIEYWPSVGCNEKETETEIVECVARTTSTDVTDFEGLNSFGENSRAGFGVLSEISVDNPMTVVEITETTITLRGKAWIGGEDPFIITLTTGGGFSGRWDFNTSNIFSHAIVDWHIEDTDLVLIDNIGIQTKFKGSRE